MPDDPQSRLQDHAQPARHAVSDARAISRKREPDWVKRLAGAQGLRGDSRRVARAARASSCTTARRTPTATSTSATRSTRSSRTSSSRASSWRASTRRTCPAGTAMACRSKCRSRRRTASTCRRRRRSGSRAPTRPSRSRKQKEGFQRLGRAGRLGASVHDDGLTRTRPTRSARSARMLEKGFVYRGLKPVNWCFDCQSALAEAEVEYEDRVDIAIDVGFTLDPREDAETRRGVRACAQLPAGPRARDDLDDDALDDSRQPGAERASGTRVRAGRRHRTGHLVARAGPGRRRACKRYQARRQTSSRRRRARRWN